jgi:hypothetical protein
MNKFWGYQYIIEQLPQFSERSGKTPSSNTIPSDVLNMKVGVWNFEPTTKYQKDYLDQCHSRTKLGRFNCEVWNDDGKWEEFLPSCDSQILYFFSHGHTEIPAAIADKQHYNLITVMKKWLEQPSLNESTQMARYRQHLLEDVKEIEDKNLLHETYIRLTKGYLSLQKLQNMALDTSEPLVFLNMCESAQVFPNISEGLIDAFLKKGARNVIGTEIPMLDRFADLFSRQFFDALFFGLDKAKQPMSIGEIMYNLRRKFMELGNPLGFAYTSFGDVTTRLSKSL